MRPVGVEQRGGPVAIGVAALLAALLGGCSAGPGATRTPEGPPPVDAARTALAAGNLDAASSVIEAALAVPAPADAKDGDKDKAAAPVIRSTPDTAELLVLRAELRIRQQRYPEAESDALTAMALVPATPSAEMPAATAPYGPRDARDKDGKKDEPPRRPPFTQRGIHMRLAQLYEDAGRDDNAEQHLSAARELCRDDAELNDAGDCETERLALVRIRLARGHYPEAEPLVLEEIANVQSRYGAYDLRLSVALCDAARFYARQGKYALSGPLFTRSFDLWKTVREDAWTEHQKALAAGQPSPFDAAFLRPAAGHFPFAAPCGLEDQPGLLYKLGKAGVAADAVRFEQQLWSTDTEAGTSAVAYLDALVAKAADPLDIASARHAVAFVAGRKGDQARAEQELRAVVEAYAAAWPALPISERRYRAEDYLGALESLIELLRSSRRFAEAIALGERAGQIAAETVDIYDSLRLDTLLSVAKTFREMKDPANAEAAAGRYLDAIVGARGDRSADYAWALRTISYAYLLRDELDASQRMEMQAKAIWAKQDIIAPAF